MAKIVDRVPITVEEAGEVQSIPSLLARRRSRGINLMGEGGNRTLPKY